MLKKCITFFYGKDLDAKTVFFKDDYEEISETLYADQFHFQSSVFQKHSLFS